jgi:hypothetical protein
LAGTLLQTISIRAEQITSIQNGTGNEKLLERNRQLSFAGPSVTRICDDVSNLKYATGKVLSFHFIFQPFLMMCGRWICRIGNSVVLAYDLLGGD